MEDKNYNSNIPSTSTAAPKGKEFTLIAARVCLPSSPNIFDIKSEELPSDSNSFYDHDKIIKPCSLKMIIFIFKM